MEILKTTVRKSTYLAKSPATWIDGSMMEKTAIHITRTLKVTDAEFERIENILALSDKQYKKFIKKFR